MNTIVARHENRVYGLSFRFMGNDADAWDATQEVFIRLMRKASQFQGRSAFSTWLYRMCVNVCKDQLRKKKRLPDPTEVLPVVSEATEVGSRLDVERALASLPQDQRAPLVLRVFEDLSYKEIAEALELPIGTVKSRIARARAQLARLLGEPERAGSRLRESDE